MRIILAITLLESLAITSWFVLQHFRSEYSKMPATTTMIPIVSNVPAKPSISASLEASRWSVINGWKVAAQADDRSLTLGTVAENFGSASARRSFARRSHQHSFKAWSQQRHD